MVIMEYTTVRISTWLKDKLDKLGGRGETWEDILIRQLGLVEEYKEYVRGLNDKEENK